MNDSPIEVCYHEAGHAIVGCAVGCQVGLVSAVHRWCLIVPQRLPKKPGTAGLNTPAGDRILNNIAFRLNGSVAERLQMEDRLDNKDLKKLYWVRLIQDSQPWPRLALQFRHHFRSLLERQGGLRADCLALPAPSAGPESCPSFPLGP